MRMSVHMLVRDGARVVERGLRSLLGFADEVVLVDSASTDGTAGVAEDFCRKNGLAFQCVPLSPATHPDLFLLDEPSTWRRPVPGPFTGLHVLKRFDLARNLGLEACRGKYVFKLDADDEVVDASGVAHLVAVFEECPWLDLGMHPYHSVAGQGSDLAHLNLFWRNKPEVRFTQAIHEWHLGGHEVDVRTPDGVARVEPCGHEAGAGAGPPGQQGRGHSDPTPQLQGHPGGVRAAPRRGRAAGFRFHRRRRR